MISQLVGKFVNKWALFSFINPAFWLSLGFAYISASVRLDDLAKKTGYEFISLYGFLSYEKALQFSVFLHGNLDKHSLIPPLFLLGMIILFFKHYKKSNLHHNKLRAKAALQLTVLEGLFVATALFGGCLLDMTSLAPTAISNQYLIWGITVSMAILIPKGLIAESISSYFEKHSSVK